MNTYHGSCHCGTVRFEVNAQIDKTEQFKPIKFDGRNWEQAAARIRDVK